MSQNTNGQNGGANQTSTGTEYRGDGGRVPKTVPTRPPKK